METLKLYWLGTPLIELRGRAVKLETRKAAAMVAYLSLTPRECQRETLATMFWPEGSQQKALANLRRTLSSLNSNLPKWIEANRETITLKRNVKFWVDVEAFHRSLSQLKEHPHPANQVCEACLSVLENMANLYRGDFLESLNLRECQNFDEWQFFVRDELRQELANVLQRLSSGHGERSQWDQAIKYARRWVALDHLSEPACRVLMDLYARSGQRTAALHQYEEMARLLHKQMAQPPESETRRLYEQIRSSGAIKHVDEAAERPTLFPLLKTKLYIPSAPTPRAVRSDLITRLDAVEKKALTIISAPAGFGKTTLLAEWIEQTTLPVAWFSLDTGDNDPYRFLSYLIEALEGIQEDAGLEARQIMQSPELAPPHIILTSLINRLGRAVEPAVLILDDYQFIDEHAVHQIMGYLLDHLPSTLHIVLATRADPPLQLGRLRVHDQLFELRTHDLRLNHQEAVTFLNDVMQLDLSASDIDILDTRTEGWVVGLKMAALSLKDHENASQFIRDFSGSHRYVLDYLVEEVLQRQPAHVQNFLSKTSILEKLNGPLCDALMTEQWRQSGENGQAVLEYLERNNLFLISMDDERKWFRYHHLFADLLQTRLKQSDPELEAACHRQAARWFAENSYRVEAVDHALVGKDFSLAADFIEQFALSLIARNEIMTIMRWINSLTYEVIHHRPRLVLYQAWVLARLGDFKNLECLLQEAENMLMTGSGLPDLDELRNYLVQLRAYIANIKGDPDLAIEVALGAEERSEQVSNSAANSNYLIGFQLGYACYSKGDLDAAENIFQSVAKSAEVAEDIYNTIIAHVELAGIQLLRGNLLQAEEKYDYAQQWLDRSAQNPALLEGILKVCRASILLERNELLKANRLVREGIEEALLGSRTNTIAYGYVVLASILRAQGDFLQAREAVEKATIQIQQRRTYPRTVKNAKTCQVDQWLAEGNLTAAQKWACEEFQVPYGPMPFHQEVEYIALARVLLASKQFEEASDLLRKMAGEAERGGREGRLIKINILCALARNGLGQVEEALQVLEKGLAKGQREGYLRVFLDEGAQLANLLRSGKQQGIWREREMSGYVDKLLDAFGET